MQDRELRAVASRIRESGNPLAAGKELLLEEFRKTCGVRDARLDVTASFEILRSLVVQTIYEVSCQPGMEWLEAGSVEPESVQAKLERALYLDGEGLGKACAGAEWLTDGEKARLAMLEDRAMGHERFLGSYRSYLAGAGYAVSVRKRSSHNQDSFALYANGASSAIAVADGCGSDRFSAIASHMSAARAVSPGLDKAAVCALSAEIAHLFNGTLMVSALKSGSSSTLVAGSAAGRARRVLKVGDSMAYRLAVVGDGMHAETLADTAELRNVIGQVALLRESEVEEHSREGGRLVLVSDGVTYYLQDAASRIGHWAGLTDDPVFLAEKIVRSALRNQAEWGHADDVTVIVQDTRR
ncbi:MAG: protein phosphatase 2C domain-containing protein [Candidatus Micrarchaeota archaeon]